MLSTLLVGLGRSGLGLHLPSLRKARADAEAGWLFASEPVLGYDPRLLGDTLSGVAMVASLAEARAACDPERTVVHVCTPPNVRASLLAELAGLGFRRILIEKPLAASEDELQAICALRDRGGLHLALVAPWLTSTLTAEIRQIVGGGELGLVRTIQIVQSKPRFTRSAADCGHLSAFDVEMPHSVGLALELLGPAEVTGAHWADMTFGDRRLPRMGCASMALSHAGGIQTKIFADLTAPTRERRVSIELEHGTIVGHYACDDSDLTAQIRILRAEGTERRVLADDALTANIISCYGMFARGDEDRRGFELGVRSVLLLSAAKQLARRRDLGQAVQLPPLLETLLRSRRRPL